MNELDKIAAIQRRQKLRQQGKPVPPKPSHGWEDALMSLGCVLIGAVGAFLALLGKAAK